LLAGAAMAELAAARNGEAVVLYGAGEVPTVEDLRQLLFGGKAPDEVVTRGLVMNALGASPPPPASTSAPSGEGDRLQCRVQVQFR
jgi:hypothetical protein